MKKLEYSNALNNLIAIIMVFQGIMLFIIMVFGTFSDIGSSAYGWMTLSIWATTIHGYMFLKKSNPIRTFKKLYKDATN